MTDAMDHPSVTFPEPRVPAGIPDVQSQDRNAKEPCPECDKPIAIGYMRTHLRNIHHIEIPASRRGRKRGGNGPREKCPECGGSFAANYLTDHRRKEHGVRQRRARTVEVKDWSADDIFDSVISVLYPDGTVPLSHLSALREFYAAAERLLGVAQGE